MLKVAVFDFWTTVITDQTAPIIIEKHIEEYTEKYIEEYGNGIGIRKIKRIRKLKEEIENLSKNININKLEYKDLPNMRLLWEVLGKDLRDLIANKERIELRNDLEDSYLKSFS